MRTVRDLLQEADPLRHEPLAPAGERDRRRAAAVAATSDAANASSAWFRSRGAALVTIALIVAGMVAVGAQIWSQGGAALQAAIRFEVRLAEERPAAGLTEARVPGSDRRVFLHRDTIVTNDDVARSSVVQGRAPSRFDIGVQFTAAGAEKMRVATTKHIGRPVAILIDGAVIIAPVLRAPIDTAATISGDYTKADAERIVDGIGLR